MRVCMCVHARVYACVHGRVHARVYTCIMRECVRVRVHACVSACVHVSVCIVGVSEVRIAVFGYKSAPVYNWVRPEYINKCI